MWPFSPPLLPPMVDHSIPAIFHWPIQFYVTITATTYILSLITNNVSQVDRVWTFLPTIYTAYFALLPLWPSTYDKYWITTWFWPCKPDILSYELREEYSPRALVMLVLVTLWMTRLSYNTWRRGLFSLSDEDYRWAVLRNKVPAWFFQLTNLFFIAIIQNIILFLLGIPTATATLQPRTALTTSDYVLFAAGLLTLFTEFTADNQQFSYQSYKTKFKQTGYKTKHNKNEWWGARIRWTEADVERGFVTRGLWAWTRHPNFLCEQLFWIIITLFPILSPSRPNPPLIPTSFTPVWPLVPALVLCVLFYSSTLFTESISLSKYPIGYKMYQERVAMFLPILTPFWGLLAEAKGRVLKEQMAGRRKRLDKYLFGRNILDLTGRLPHAPHAVGHGSASNSPSVTPSVSRATSFEGSMSASMTGSGSLSGSGHVYDLRNNGKGVPIGSHMSNSISSVGSNGFGH